MAKTGRFELKYVVTETVARALVSQLQAYCAVDTAGSADGNYIVTSLYLDSPDWAMHRAVMTAQPIRLKARVRTYGPGSKGAVWVELKHRFGEVIVKQRARVAESRWQPLIDRFGLSEPEHWRLSPEALKTTTD